MLLSKTYGRDTNIAYSGGDGRAGRCDSSGRRGQSLDE